MFIAPVLASLLKDKEWASTVSGVVDFVYDVSNDLIGTVAFPWVAGALFGLFLGFNCHRLFRYVSEKISRNEKNFSFLERCSIDVLVEFDAIHPLSGPSITPSLAGSIDRLFIKLHELGVATPKIDMINIFDNRALVLNYVSYIYKFLPGRDLEQLKQRAKAFLGTTSKK